MCFSICCVLSGIEGERVVWSVEILNFELSLIVVLGIEF